MKLLRYVLSGGILGGGIAVKISMFMSPSNSVAFGDLPLALIIGGVLGIATGMAIHSMNTPMTKNNNSKNAASENSSYKVSS